MEKKRIEEEGTHFAAGQKSKRRKLDLEEKVAEVYIE